MSNTTMKDRIEPITITENSAQSPYIPIAILESLLRDHLAGQTATITSCESIPFSHLGTNDSSTVFRVTLTWTYSPHSLRTNTATWIVKRWKAGGVRDSALGIFQPREVLAWERGWLHSTALPAGMLVPFIGARRSPDNTEAWLAMADVSTDLSAYSRLTLSGNEAVSLAQAILARLATFHAMWERPERQAELQACSWLRRPEIYLWDMAATYARALGRSPNAQIPLYASAPPVWSSLRADLDAFLEGRPSAERQLWEHLMVDRRALVEGLAAYPQTLLHNDLDDRNIGLRWPNSRNGRASATNPHSPATPDLVLIDWEWISLGAAAIDVANLIQRLPIMLAPGTPAPEAVWSGELADYYFAHYRAAGGRCIDASSWRRSYGLAFLASGITQMPFVHGSLRRAIRGEIPLPQIVGVPEEVLRQNLRDGLPLMQRMEEQVIREATRQLALEIA